MKTPLCELLGVEFPLFAFSHCRDVVAAVTNAGGFGVLGASRHTPEELELELKWIDEHVHGRPYGVDILIPENMVGRDGSIDVETLRARVPTAHKEFVQSLLARYGVTIDLDDPRVAKREMPLLPQMSARLMDVAFSHPIKLIANALGVPPQAMIDRARAQGVPVAALVGAKEHAIRQVQAGVDIIVAEGSEAGGHTGEVTTLVLVPEVIRAIKPIRPVPVLAAGGIVTGRQMAAMMALGAAGAWTGTVWLMTSESEASPLIQQKFAAATSRDTVRSKSRTGKYTRQLRSAWTDAWAGPDSPGPLPMPLQLFLSEPALRRAEHEASRGNRKAEDLVTYYVGQGVGLLDQVKTSRAVVLEFMEEFAEAAAEMAQLTDE
ncbi:MAG TPA: nitronate monooxygenase [Steroidobacteraceae bacterium]|nr:nitronate monooxygenase [Steroidobacteraceae bacterium]